MTIFNDELDTKVFHTILNSFHPSLQFTMEQKNNFIFFWMSWYNDLILSLLHSCTVKLYFQVCILAETLCVLGSTRSLWSRTKFDQELKFIRDIL